jgi:hypothetical protein
MVIYEVNLVIDKAIVESFMDWLKPHVTEILCFEGFLSAQCLEQTTELKEGSYQLTMQYRIQSMENLNYYLMYHAQAMRSIFCNKKNF